MRRRDIQRWKRGILFLVLLPALLACILFSLGGNGAGQGGKAPSDGSRPSSASAGSADTDTDSDQSASPAGNAAVSNARSGSVSGGKEGANGTAWGIQDLFPANADPDSLAPLEKICFTVKDNRTDRAQQRSIPVQMSASILGGDSDETIWAVFLPGEMSRKPHVCFTDYTEISLEPLPGEERYTGGRLGPEGIKASGADSDSAADRTQPADADSTGDGDDPAGPDDGKADGNADSRTFASGDAVEGLSNGSAFRVRMTGRDGDSQEEVLYVFSCTGTASLYLDTESGSMANVDDDHLKETSEQAQFRIYTQEGVLDSTGTCSVSGRGNSTWNMKKRPYNLKLDQDQSILGMSACKKLCLLANTFDLTNLLDRVSSQLALRLGMRDTPEGEFVNLYLNGKYNGLYYLSQRVRTGGSVHIDKLDKKILQANGAQEEDAETVLPKRIALHEEGSSLYKFAYNWPNEPANNTGGYLLQQYERYDGDECWFSTEHRRFRISSPSYPTPGEVNYLQDYMMTAERAIYSGDGKDPETGTGIAEILDLPSWEDMFLLEEYFVEWDAERWSFYITKDLNDPLLHCGPMWDFDHSAGTMLYGTYPETAVSTLMLRDNRHGWLNRLLTHEDFVLDLYRRWIDRFSPAVHEYLDTQLEKEIAAIESAAYMNNIRRSNDTDFREDTAALASWLQRRAAFLDDYVGDGKKAADGSIGNTEAYCRIIYQFPWGDLSRYVRTGSTLDCLPLAEYGETQIPTQIKKHEIIGWQDEDGNPVGADLVISENRTFSPIYK